MKIIDRLRTWWQVQTGEEETPFDGDTPAWVVSMVFHLGLLVAIAFFTVVPPTDDWTLTFTTQANDVEEEEFVVPEEVFFSEQKVEDVGANSFDGMEVAFAEAPNLSEVSQVPTPVMQVSEVGNIEINEMIEVATGPHFNESYAVKGAAGVGETGAKGAVDRITQEILQSLEERKTMVVWLFDQSGSLSRQRSEIHDRFDRIYEELGVLEAAGNEAFAKYDSKPLLTSVVAFGENVTLRTPKPTDDLAEIKKAVADIELDRSGKENVFAATYMAIDRYKTFRVPNASTGKPERNVMLVVFSDEVGDDQSGLEHTIKLARRYAVPVYVVGVPAPFGRVKTEVKWVDPDPNYDQKDQWGEVTQGPESFLPERIKLHFSGSREDKDPIDSGFGPFSLTRLCYETGGIYFAVHPNRRVGSEVSRKETAAMSAHIEHFFDPHIMRRYRPDYVSQDEYQRRVQSNKARETLIKAAEMSWITPMENPQLTFVKLDEAAFANALTEAQKDAAALEPKVITISEILKLGEADREKEMTPRWQAGYDLAMGRALAVKVRTEAYNIMLASAKTGLKFENPDNNTWKLSPSDDFSTLGSQLEKQAEKAKMYLQRVVDEHPGTPWALLAKRELDAKIGWVWEEDRTEPPAPRNNNPAAAAAAAAAANPANPNMPKRKTLRRPPQL